MTTAAAPNARLVAVPFGRRVNLVPAPDLRDVARVLGSDLPHASDRQKVMFELFWRCDASPLRPSMLDQSGGQVATELLEATFEHLPGS